MSLTISLLGRPALEDPERSGISPRGAKAWGLLAYLLLSERPATRRQLAALLFPDADDPLGALRWNLAELRRALGTPDVLRGDPPELELPRGTVVDVHLLTSRGPVAREWLGRLSGELLDGLSYGSCPGFDAWLSVARRHMVGAAEALLHETALAELAARRFCSGRAARVRRAGAQPARGPPSRASRPQPGAGR